MEHQRDYALIVLIASVFLDAVSINMVLPILPFFAQELGADAIVVTSLTSSFALAAMLAASTYGRAASLFGFKPVLVAGFACTTLGLLLTSVAPNLTVLLVARVLMGLGAGKLVLAQGYASRGDRATRSGRLGKVSAALGSGLVLGPLFGVGIGALGFRQVFLGAAALNLIVAVYFALSHVSFGDTKSQEHVAEKTGNLHLLALIAISFFLASGIQINLSITALWAQSQLSWSFNGVGILLGLVGIVSILTQVLLTGRIAKILSPELVLTASAALAAAAVSSVVAVGNAGTLVVAQMFLALSLSLASNSANTLISLQGTSATNSLGLAQIGKGIGQVGSPLLAGYLFQHLSINAPYLLCAASLMCAAMISYAMLPHTKAQKAAISE